MRKLLILTLIICSLSGGVIPADAQNPFTSKTPPKREVAPPKPPHPFLAKIAFWQYQLNQKMAGLVREAKQTGSLRPLLSLMLMAFVYGILHAAGPGHGKAVAMSYLISRGGKIGPGILFGSLIALFHGMSAICLVLVLHYVLQKGVSGSLEAVSHKTKLVSYSLISLMGTALFIRSLLSWRREECQPESPGDGEAKQRGPLAVALTVGMVPCPGVVLVMLFSLSMNMIGLGILLGLSLSAGMAMTISMIVVLGLVGKSLILKTVGRRQELAKTVERVLETAAAFMVILLGLTFLSVTI